MKIKILILLFFISNFAFSSLDNCPADKSIVDKIAMQFGTRVTDCKRSPLEQMDAMIDNYQNNRLQFYSVVVNACFSRDKDGNVVVDKTTLLNLINSNPKTSTGSILFKHVFGDAMDVGTSKVSDKQGLLQALKDAGYNVLDENSDGNPCYHITKQ